MQIWHYHSRRGNDPGKFRNDFLLKNGTIITEVSMPTFTRTSIAALLLVLLCQNSFATGALFVRPLNSNATYQTMWIKSYDATVAIQDQLAVTHVDQVCFNETNTRVEATYIFPLPEGAVITELVYWFNGQRYVASIRERQEAQQAYDQRIRQLIDPALLQYLGNNLFKLNIAPINAQSEVRFEITYVELLPYDFGNVDYRFFLRTTELSPKPLQRVTLEISAETAKEFKAFTSPSHGTSTATQIEQLSPSKYRVLFGDENFLPDRDFLLRFETRRAAVDMNVITYSPANSDSFGLDSFYALWITPPDSISPETTIPRSIVFTADVSSSMEGERLVQLKQALDSFLDHLQEADRFNIVTFGTNVVTFRQDLVPAGSAEIAAARSFVSGLSALGLTNIDGALKASESLSFSDATANMIIFLTDGYPTWGEMRIDAIVDSAAARNRRNIRIFPFGIGEDISKPLLIELARRNGGYPIYVTATDSIALVVADQVNRISKPVLSELAIDMGGLQTYDRYPVVLSDLFYGSQVLQFGRYTNAGTFAVTLRGKARLQDVTLTSQVNFSDITGGHRAVPRLWAKNKIDYLLEQIEILGEQKELVDAIIDLSIRYGILTKYTALYVDPTAVDEREPVVLPKTFVLEPNYPNPFNPETQIGFYVPATAQKQRVVIKIYDMLGRVIRILLDREFAPGHYVVRWDGKDASGYDLPSGTYLYRLEAGAVVIAKKMTLLR
jgi:Ca-activated chloride channel family protein